MAFKKGAARPANSGRKKGTPNKATASVRAALEEAFEQLGGVETLAQWAEDNPGEFFKLWVKILPRDVNVEQRLTLEDLVCKAYSRPAE
ncbi:MAG: hypothetical protein M0017_10400 [Desulfobacteraceae bacterium]|nr:hypothetical protein [Desulfobacteraceae bacterium]